jgi:anaerobic ribonucleoside-triphosphate reductase activating protein
MAEQFIALHAFLPVSTVNGPGRRSVIWVQGCIFDCPGCFNQAARPFTRNWLVTERELLAHLPADIEGLTISGGEPFCQAQALIGLCRAVKAHGLSVMLYSGYTLAELEAAPAPAIQELLGQLDILVDGPYRHDIPAVNPWAGSGNQQVHYLSPRYREAGRQDSGPGTVSYAEIIIDETGQVIQTGF